MIKDILKLLIPGFAINKKIYCNYKISSFFYQKGFKFLAKFYMNKIYRKYNCCISYKAIIGKNVEFPHPTGIVIGGGVEIGDNVVIYQNVTLGRKNREIEEVPKIGNNVIIYCNSVVIGNITIGDNTIIGCNSTVLKSVESNSKCVGVVK